MNARISAAGVHRGMDAAAYHADPCVAPSLSAGCAVRLIQATPLHAWTDSARLNPDFEPVEKEAFDIGSAAHARLTGSGATVYRVDADTWQTKAAKEARDIARASGLTPLLAKQDDRVQAMVRLARVQMRAHGIGDPFEGGDNEVSMFWHAAGVWRRCRPDCIDHERRVIYDYKTTAELAEPDAWVRRAYGMGVDIRAAHYLDGADALLDPGKPWRYRFVVQEVKPPHALSVIELSQDAVYFGRRKLEQAAAIWRECLTADRWPAWSSEIVVVDAPKWDAPKWLEREERDAAKKELTGSAIARAIEFQAPRRPS